MVITTPAVPQQAVATVAGRGISAVGQQRTNAPQQTNPLVRSPNRRQVTT